MTVSTFISSLQSLLLESSLPRVLSALRNNPLIWDSLSGEFGELVLKRKSINPDDYSPAGLALIALDLPITAASLRLTPMEPALDDHISSLDTLAEKHPLAREGILALQIRELRRVKGSWDNFPGDFGQISSTSLACLYGMVPNPDELLPPILALEPERTTGKHGIGLILSILFSNPLSQQTLANSLHGLSQLLSKTDQIILLRHVSRQRPQLASLLSPDKFFRDSIDMDNRASPVERSLAALSDQIRDMEAHQYTENHSQALVSLGKTVKASRGLAAQLAAKKAWFATRDDESETAISAWEKACKLDPNSPTHLAHLALALIDVGRTADAQARLSGSSADRDHPLLSTTRARLFLHRNDTDGARDEAIQSLQVYLANPDVLDGAQRRDLVQLIRTFLELHLPYQATRANDLALGQWPNDPELLALMRDALTAALELDKAIDIASLIVALSPEQAGPRRNLAENFELKGQWAAALEQRKAYFELVDSPDLEDFRTLANCSLRAGHPEKAVEICQQSLLLNDDDGETYAILGQAYAASGDNENALNELQRATQLSPEQPAPWLALSAYHKNAGRDHKAKETLQSAILATPEQAELHLVLGLTYIEESALTQALASFRRASDLVSTQPIAGTPESSLISSLLLRHRISLNLGKTLRDLGHFEEARQVLNDAFQRTPTNIEVASILAKTLIDMDKRHLAILPLETVLDSNPEEPTPYLEYARCLLTLSEDSRAEANDDRLLPTLQRILQLDPVHPEGTVLLAEAHAARGEYLVAMDAYQKAMEANLEQDSEWRCRSILGMGRVALKLGQIETAVASLEEANQIAPADPKVKRYLSEAYEAAGLTEYAFQAASSALELSPNDVETITWFADQTLRLSIQRGINLPTAQTDVLDALERATLLAPHRSDIWLKLGRAFKDAGNQEAALNTFKYLAEIDEPKSKDIPTDLYKAADSLLQLEDYETAATCLQRALEFKEESGSDSTTSIIDLYLLLSKTHFLIGDFEAALGSMDKAIKIEPDQASLYLKKIDMLQEIEGSMTSEEALKVNQSEALSCVERALQLNPDDIDLLHRAAQVYRVNGKLGEALASIERVITLKENSSLRCVSARLMAADLSLAMLNPDGAYKSIDYRQPIPEDVEYTSQDEMITHHCLRADLALSTGDDPIAIEELAIVCEGEKDHPWIHSLKSRIAHLSNDRQAALEELNRAVESLNEDAHSKVPALRGTIEAAIEIGEYDLANQLANRLIKIAPHEPLSSLLIARVLTLRGEYMHLCQALDIVKQAPDESSLSFELYQQFEGAIQAVKEEIKTRSDKSAAQFDNLFIPQHPNTTSAVERWYARGNAAFQPNKQHAEALAKFTSNPNDVAALVACLRQVGDLSAAGYAAREFPRHPMVLIQLALALEEEKPRQAMAAVHAAADVLAHLDEGRLNGYKLPQIEVEPIIHALLARLFLNSGNRAGDQENALQAIQIALAYWPDEPRWHTLAAAIYLKQAASPTMANIEAAIPHLEQAIHLEPERTQPYITLGNIYFEAGYLDKAIQTLEQATRLSPEESEAWLMLAYAFYNSGDLKSAEDNAERAVTLLPNKVEPLLLRGQIALDSDQPGIAQNRAQAALRIDPDNPKVMLLMAQALRALGRYEESLSIIEIALPLADDSIPFWLEKVRIMNQTNDQEMTLDLIQQLNEKYPDEPRVLALMAQTLEAAQHCDEAIQTAQRALRAQTSSYPLSIAEQAKLHYLLGSLFRCSGQLDQAVYHLNEAVRLAPAMIDAYLELGLTHQERREHNQALAVYRRAIEAVPNDYRAYFQVGVALKESKDYIGAEKMLRRAAELTPNDPGIHRLLAAVVALNLVHSHRKFSGDTHVNI